MGIGIRAALLAWVISGLCFPALAAENQPVAKPVHAIAMHGTPKYASATQTLDYTSPLARKGGKLTQSVAGTFDTLNPFTLKGKAAQGLDYVYDKLTARVWDEPFTLYGLIAQEMIVPDDRASITFLLDPRARFHDGKPITAADVLFSYETLKKYGRPNMRRVYGLVSRATIENDRRIRFDLGPGHDRETVMILAMMPVLPKHVWQGRNFDETTLVPPVGSGPYRVKSVEAGRRIEYERVENDWAANNISRKGHNNFDTLVFDYYRDDSVALEAFKAHDVDVRREFDTAKWQTAYNDVSPEIRLESLPHGRPEWVKGFIFNLRRAPFDNPAIRRAISLAFDENFINNTLYRGQAKRINSIFPNTELAATTTPATANANQRAALKEADRLLAATGYVVKNGQRISAATGKPLTFQILLASAQDEKTALALTGGLKKLGISATIRTVDAAQFAGALAAYDYDTVLHYWVNSLSPGTEQMLYWGCDAAKTQGSKNYSGICKPETDSAAKAIATAKTRAELVKAAQKLDQTIMSENLFIPLFTIGRDYWASWNTIRHPDKTPLYGQVLETWWAR